jgi:serine phosphatase RsbU (regulator of sigma subunit)
MQCVELTPAAGIVAVANAGHPYPVFYSAMRQKSDVVPIQGPRLHGSQIKGAGPAYEQRHLEIADGDVIVLMSDGLTEIGRLVDPYGDRFTTLVEKRAAADAQSICQAILDDWLAHPRDPQWIDDLSIVVIVVARRGQDARHAVD